MILIVDNYDSFTFNLVQYLYQLNKEVVVIRNDELALEDIESIQPTHILLSPGPGNPGTAGICLDIVKQFYQKYPILGVCLGHQIIAEAFGGNVIKAKEPTHGKVSSIKHDGRGMFTALPNPLQITRYHSLMVDSNSFPECLEVSAYTESGDIAALRHRHYPVEGIQGHPESILSESGLSLLSNFFNNKGGE
ncbi:anthranilate synthase component II [Ornithinibacillus californiensis]|uniref:anthranilate synthase component II n=1 Tax=Ornithinibacillus californiensis TaxID=161536 RepID=UPI00064DC004|nr:aminodeoxychorismate/anthranilate synthase component II [Ornithinibacillus californiensis]